MPSNPLPVLLALAMLGYGAVAQAQMPAKPLRVIQARPVILPQQPPLTLEPKVLVIRPGAKTATQFRKEMTTATARFRKPGTMIAAVGTVTISGISRVNGATSGVLEPGGGYEITGRDFGTASGSAFLRLPGGRMIPLSITHWSDSAVYAQMPDDISGLPDSSAELAIGPRGKPAFKSTKFGFRAAREDINLPIQDAMFRHEGAGSVQVAGATIPVNSPPTRRTFDGKWYEVFRYVQDADEKKCIAPGRDRINWGNLKNGFTVTSFYYERMRFKQGEHDTPRGNWAFEWEGNSIRVDFGVMRYYVPRYALLPASGNCSSNYKINLIATGPRGVSPI